MPASISVVINTLNEEQNIGECVRSVQGFADEIIVCDMHSTDRTQEIARELGAKVVLHERTGYVEPARYQAISQAAGEWILVLDADERLTPDLAARLRTMIDQPEVAVVKIWILFLYFGDWVRHGNFFSGNFARFFRKSAYLETYSEVETGVHRNFRALSSHPAQIQLDDSTPILHYAYPTIEKYISKTLGYYGRIEGEQYFRQGRKFSLVRLVGEPVKEILQRFFLRGGYRDGVRGLILAVLYGGYRFSVWANVWYQEDQQRRKLTR